MKKLCNAFIMSLTMFSAIPIHINIWDKNALNFIIPMLPIVGLIIGILWYFVSTLIILTKIPLIIQSAIIMFIPLFLSGFIHIDGYMDTSDAIFSRATLEKKRTILKDSHVGAFAVIALCVLLTFTFCSIYAVVSEKTNFIVFIFIPVLSRSITGNSLLSKKLISDTGFGATFRENTNFKHIFFLRAVTVLCLFIAYFIEIKLFLTLIFLIVTAILSTRYVVKQLEGISGDLCGFIICVSEALALLFYATY